jgi:hypothetical protein
MAANILKKIQSVATLNDESIARIKSKGKVSTFKYILEAKNEKGCQFTVKEFNEESDTDLAWKRPIEMIPIPDIFNDNIIINCTSFEDLERLNKEFLQVSLKYRLFGDSEEVKKNLVMNSIPFSFLTLQRKYSSKTSI